MPQGGSYGVNAGFGEMHSYTIHEPVGVVGTPLELLPFPMGAWKLAPALAAGNSVIFKPSSNCVLSTVKMFEIFEKAGMPKGSVNLILGPGGSVGSAIAAHPGISMVTFTGSTAVGQDIMRCAAANVKKIGLELGKIPQHHLCRRRPGRGRGVGHDRDFLQPGGGLLRRVPDPH